MYFILFKDSQNQWRWNMNSANHKIIATSGEGYFNRQDALHGLNLVKVNASAAAIYDKTLEKWI